MPRTKEFDEVAVLDQALELFRTRGFKSTSFGELTSRLGVSRQSLYDTYGDKETLYETALRRYLDRGLDRIRARLAEERPVREFFAGILEYIIAQDCEGCSPGCLMVNSMVELAPQDPRVRALALRHAREVEGLFAGRLAAAQRSGELAAGKDPVALAQYFYHTILGLAVAARALNEREALRQTAQVALQVLE
jgi:TetR/AcrR family transcriptional regulator, transcriptional repressor for nem operon